MNKRVLIVDDALFMRITLKSIFDSMGIEVVGQAKNGYEAIEMYKEHKENGKGVDLVMLDITMEGMDGLTALKHIRQYDPQAPVVMCTADTKEASIVEAISMGAVGFVAKPFEKETIIETVKKVLEI